MKKNKVVLLFLLLCGATVASCQVTSLSFPTRRALIADVCPHLKLTSFSFSNYYERSLERYNEDFNWENIGMKEIVAFELVILKFDPFNRALVGSRDIFPGHKSTEYVALKPKEMDSDGHRGIGPSGVYTEFAYIRSIRFADDTIWTAKSQDVLAAIKKQAPDILDPGPLVPDPPATGKSGG